MGKVRHYGRHRLVFLAAWAALAGLAFVVWAVLDPRPVPIVLGMAVGQSVCLLALALFVFAILLDLRKHNVLDDDAPAGNGDRESVTGP